MKGPGGREHAGRPPRGHAGQHQRGGRHEGDGGEEPGRGRIAGRSPGWEAAGRQRLLLGGGQTLQKQPGNDDDDI